MSREVIMAKKEKDEKKVFRKELLTARKNLLVIGVCFVIALIVQAVNVIMIASTDENSYTINCSQITSDEYRYVLTEENAAAGAILEVTIYDYQEYKRLGAFYCKYKLLRDRIEIGLEILLICAILFVLDSLVNDVRRTEDYFTVSTAKRIRQIGAILWLFVLLPKALLSFSDLFVLTSFNFTISATDIFLLVLGDVFYIISKIIHAGREMKEELEQIA